MGTVKFDVIHVNNSPVLIRTFTGTIIASEVTDSFDYILNNHLTKDHNFSGLITDLSNANLDFKLSEFRSLVTYIKSKRQLTRIPYAVIVNSPINSLFPSLVSKFLDFQIKPFKTLDGALNWYDRLNSLKTS